MNWVTEVAAIPDIPQSQTVVITAGHSDTDPGVVAQGTTEAAIVTDFRDLVSECLTQRGIRHLTDGPDDQNWPLSKAVKLATSASIAVEFHCNAASPAATGTETLSRAKAFPFAERLCAVTSDVLGIRNRGAKPEDSGQHQRLAFVSDGGGVIHELFFLTSASDLAAYRSNKAALAEGVADVIAAAARQ